jgi:hypothetical protein
MRVSWTLIRASKIHQACWELHVMKYFTVFTSIKFSVKLSSDIRFTSYMISINWYASQESAGGPEPRSKPAAIYSKAENNLSQWNWVQVDRLNLPTNEALTLLSEHQKLHLRDCNRSSLKQWVITDWQYGVEKTSTWILPSSWMWRRVDILLTDVSEKHIASIFRV